MTIREQYIAALRSGEYKQIRGRLRSGDCFCAEGVLCDVLVKNNIGRWLRDNYLFRDDNFVSYVSSDLIFDNLGEHLPIFIWNDVDHLTFEQIAERIEK